MPHQDGALAGYMGVNVVISDGETLKNTGMTPAFMYGRAATWFA